ncbi:hypothetical protein CcCBS67573_g06381 [Chytriomyces confervae]|uniref:EF-hand domain-containing protein n=1 Tax=Chytriomyces confervae TaxID=246404 RepID=A0A507F4B9_9FUNG|nr:hypothetical protein CcCBS67573_g06381 [Chytriomyces confervae]
MSTNSNLPPIAAKPAVAQAAGKIPNTTKRAAPANAGAFSVAAIAQLALEKKKRTMKLISKMNKDNLLKDKALYRAEREINLNHFRELMTVFQNRGNKSMTMEDFKGSFGMVLGEGLNDEQMALLFMKIDANTDNAIDWEEFSAFMLLRAERQSQMLEEANTQLFEVPNPMNPTPKHSSPHRESIVNVVYLDHNKKYVTCSREGTICYWSDKFRLQKCFLNVGLKTLSLDGREVMKLLGTNKNNPLLDRETPWINDMIYMKPLNKFAIASDDHEITLYNQTTWQSKIRFDLKDCNALCLDYFVDLENQDSETSTFYFGTDGGFIYTVNIINSAFSNKNDNTKNKCVTILMDQFGRGSTKGMGSMSKRRAHDNWIGKIKYYHDWHAIVSCSIDPLASLVVALQDGKNSWTYFSAPVNHGVNTFTYSRFPVALITGGTDHQLRLWNPHRLKNPMASFKGHNSPIIDLAVNEESGQVISLSVDSIIKVWDIRKQQCVQTLFDSEPLGIDDALNRIYFTGPIQGKLFALARNVTEYRLKEKTADVSSKSPSAARSHEYPLRAALYNPTFKQVVTACDGGVVNVWDALSGLHIFKFADTHGKSELTAVTFDLGYRKLITGARDGTIHIWNFHNGQKIKELIKPDSAEVTEIIQIEMHETRYIIAVGWNRKVTIFAGNNDSDKEYPCSIYPKKNTPPWHNDDVMCVAFAPPNVLVTASFDGGIVLSNLQSGFMLKKLRWPDQEAAALNKSIEQVVFLHERLSNQAAATLLTAGGDGVIRWWRTNEAELMWEMNGVVGREGESIYAMCTNPSNSLLITGDTAGWVTIYSIKDTCIDGREDITPPKTLVEFRAHLRCIVTLDIIETNILTGSTDGTSRLFTGYGFYIGTFGQEQAWDWSEPSETFKPPDVLDLDERMERAAQLAEAGGPKGRFRRASLSVMEKLRSQNGSRCASSSLTPIQKDGVSSPCKSVTPILSRDVSISALSAPDAESSISRMGDGNLKHLGKQLSLSTFRMNEEDGATADKHPIALAASTEALPPLQPETRGQSILNLVSTSTRNLFDPSDAADPSFWKSRNINTPELMQTNYRTWFSKSHFARESIETERQVDRRRKTRQAYVSAAMNQKLPSIIAADNKISPAYHNLQPTDLSDYDVSKVLKLPAIMNQMANERAKVESKAGADKVGYRAAANTAKEAPEVDSNHVL